MKPRALHAIPPIVPEYVAGLFPFQYIPNFSTNKNNMCLKSQLLREVSANVVFSYIEAAILDTAIKDILYKASIKQEYSVIFQTLAFVIL
jgi:hypothetical protein